MIYNQEFSILKSRTFGGAYYAGISEDCHRRHGRRQCAGRIVKGAVEAVNEHKEVKIFLVGQQDLIKKELAQYTFDQTRIEIVHAAQVIDNNEHPVAAIRSKKDSSIVVAQKMVREGKADAVISAGSTGAILVGGQLVVGELKA